tara:strand:+ start:400 stop:591 length:192 start_codon:yes stop_codon:yes gene_type:complete
MKVKSKSNIIFEDMLAVISGLVLISLKISIAYVFGSMYESHNMPSGSESSGIIAPLSSKIIAE